MTGASGRGAYTMLVGPEGRSLQPVPGAPRLTAAACELLREIQIVDERGERRAASIPNERPLTLRVDSRELVTLMTLGASPELLVLGYLHNQRLIESVTELDSVSVDWATGTADVRTRSGLRGGEFETARRLITTVCGQGSAFTDLLPQTDAIRLPAAAAARIRPSILFGILEAMRRQESVHRHAGSVHGCALFRNTELLAFVEDVGRHNAVDIISGWMVLHGVSGADKNLYTTGRMTSEMVLKAAQVGVPILISRNGLSALGYEVARRLGMALIGRAANRHFLCYTGTERLETEPRPERPLPDS